MIDGERGYGGWTDLGPPRARRARILQAAAGGREGGWMDGWMDGWIEFVGAWRTAARWRCWWPLVDKNVVSEMLVSSVCLALGR